MKVVSPRAIRTAANLSLLLALVCLSGCGQSGDARFHANLLQMVANNVSEKHQQQIADILEAMYGTPDDPFVLQETGLDLQKIRIAAGPVKGYTQGLFRLHCVHCHGITGDGMGPTALFLKPYPRDYRQGLYKFKSTPSNYPPTHQDLMRTLEEGVNGTAMPSFKLLPQAEIEALVEYVKYLSLRGQTELALINYASTEVDADKDFPTGRDVLIDGDNMLAAIVGKWQSAPSQATPVPPKPADFGALASIERGKQIFYGNGGCVKCHGPTALGDGQIVADEWTKRVQDIAKTAGEQQKQLADLTGEARSVQAQHVAELIHALHVDALPPRDSAPRNLRQGIYRGGRQPYELFYRVSNGINPSNMPGIASQQGMTPDDIWHVVDFILDLPFEPGSQPPPDANLSAPPRERL